MPQRCSDPGVQLSCGQLESVTRYLIVDRETPIGLCDLGNIKKLGRIEGRRRRGQQRMRWLDGIFDTIDMSLSKLWATVKYREAWHAAIHGAAKSQT